MTRNRTPGRKPLRTGSRGRTRSSRSSRTAHPAPTATVRLTRRSRSYAFARICAHLLSVPRSSYCSPSPTGSCSVEIRALSAESADVSKMRYTGFSFRNMSMITGRST